MHPCAWIGMEARGQWQVSYFTVLYINVVIVRDPVSLNPEFIGLTRLAEIHLPQHPKPITDTYNFTWLLLNKTSCLPGRHFSGQGLSPACCLTWMVSGSSVFSAWCIFFQEWMQSTWVLFLLSALPEMATLAGPSCPSESSRLKSTCYLSVFNCDFLL